jgi:hypothetical protein
MRRLAASVLLVLLHLDIFWKGERRWLTALI